MERARDDREDDGRHTTNPIELIGRAIIKTGRRSSFGDYEDAKSDLMSRMRNGYLRVRGRRNGTGVREEIAAPEMYGVQLYPDGMVASPYSAPGRSKPHVGRPERDLPFWTDPLFEVEEVLRLWPDPLGGLAATTVGAKAMSPRGYALSDQALMPEMKKLIDGGRSRWAAARKLADAAEGGGTQESKAKRLLGRFSEFQSSQS